MLLSIIVIALNEEQFLDNCFKSIRYAIECCGLSGLSELIYVDSGSSDSSVCIAKKYTDKIVKLQPISYPGNSRNAGVKIANGKYIQFIDGDMELDSHWLKKAINILNALEECHVVGVAGIRDDVLYINNCKILKLNIYNSRYLRNSLRFGGAFFVKKQSIIDVGLFDPDLKGGEEADLHLRLIRNKSFIIDLPIKMITHHNVKKNSCLQKIKRCYDVHYVNKSFAISMFNAIRRKYFYSFIIYNKMPFIILTLDLISLAFLVVSCNAFIFYHAACLMIFYIFNESSKLFVVRLQWLGVMKYILNFIIH